MLRADVLHYYVVDFATADIVSEGALVDAVRPVFLLRMERDDPYWRIRKAVFDLLFCRKK